MSSEKRPPWVPISAFIGTTLALAIPLLVLRRQRAGLKAPPPRRTASSSLRRPVSLPVENTLSADPDRASALSHLNSSSAILAAKALAIATGIVAVGGAAFIWGVKESLGVKDAREFGNTMRLHLSAVVPSLSSAIYRPPQSEEDAHSFAPWSWDDAEMRLKRAYEEGGVSLWGQIALRELEAEARAEREKRSEVIKSRTRPS